MQIFDAQLHDQMTQWRRYLHAHPELSRQEVETASFVRRALEQMGVAVTSGIGGHGLVGTLRREGSPRAVALRADMDALPITENTGLSYASTHAGVMHACGHDGHMAALLGAAALLQRDPSWSGTVQLVFQPAEEGWGGADAMLADGLLERFPFDSIFGLHNWPGLDTGRIALHDGPVMSAIGTLQIDLHGVAAHGAMPHLGRDPVLGAAHVLVALQSIVTREVDPRDAAVVSVCVIDGGVAMNQIPQTATMKGSYRSYAPAVQATIEAAIQRIAKGVAHGLGLEADVMLKQVACATINHPQGVQIALAAAHHAALIVDRDLPPSMVSEDFGSFLNHRPGCFAWIGNGARPGQPGLHQPDYDFNDEVLPLAARWFHDVARQALA